MNKNDDSSLCAICRKHSDYEILYEKNFLEKKHLNTRIFSARRLPDKIHGSIVKCKKCGLVRSLEIIDRDQLKKLYEKSSFTYSEMTGRLQESYSLVLKEAVKYSSSMKSFMEVGCGNGFMLEEAQRLGFKKVTGVEPSTDAIKHAHKSIRNNIVQSILTKDTFKKSQFDLICAFQVFDHIPDPNSFLTICYNILKPNGVLVLMNHDVSSFSAKILGERSPIFDIEHTYLYDQNTIKRILQNNKFKVKKVYSPLAVMTIRYITRLLPLPKSVKEYLSGLKISILDKTIRFNPGNLSAIAVKK